MVTTGERRPRVLVVSPSPTAAADLGRLLRGAGYEVVDAGEGALPSDVAVADLDGRAALAARDAQLATWADRWAHDLATPLAVISGMAETLEVAWDRVPEADRVRLLRSIRSQAARATALLGETVAWLEEVGLGLRSEGDADGHELVAQPGADPDSYQE